MTLFSGLWPFSLSISLSHKKPSHNTYVNVYILETAKAAKKLLISLEFQQKNQTEKRPKTKKTKFHNQQTTKKKNRRNHHHHIID